MNIKASIIEHQQGSEAWKQHRARSLNASELAAAMGLSPYMSRADLIKQKATGIVPEVDAATQRRFDDGHAVEALARPLAEEIIGEDLYASVFAAEVDGLLLSASLDGHDLLVDVTWEHKKASAALIASLEAGVIPEQYHPQMEQGFMLSGASRCLFMASNGTRESMRSVWYESNPELRAQIIPTWKQFMADVAAYVPTAAELPKPTGRAPEALPALRVEVTGMVTASNLAEFKAQAMAVFQGISRDLKTDEDFANAEATVKWAKGIEDKVAATKASALAQTVSIDELFRTMDEVSAEARRVRLDLDKLVKARKEALKSDIVHAGRAALDQYIRELNAAMPADYMPSVPADFGGCIKNLRTLDSIQNAVDTELARAKISASEVANKIHANIARLNEANAPMLFAYDMKALVLKAPDDLAAVIAQRLAAEQARKDAERERIRAEEAARLEREAKAEADRIEQERASLAVADADRIAREKAIETAQFVSDQADRASRVCAAAVADVVLVHPEPDMHAALIGDGTPAPADLQLVQGEVGRIDSHIQFIRMSGSDRGMTGANPLTPQQCATRILAARLPEVKHTEDDGTRLTLGQINAMLAPVSITVAGLSELGYEPVEQIKAARYYRACDFRHICAAISAHVLAAPVKALEAA